VDEDGVEDDMEMADLRNGGDGDEDAEEDEDESDENSDKEQDDEDEDDEGDEGEDDEDEEEEVDEDEALALRNKIEQALRVNGIEPATGDSESEEDLMDDEQMMAIDGQLAEVFRSHIGEKKSGKRTLVSLNTMVLVLKYFGIDDAQREATYFKIRVLDLVDTFVRRQSSDPLILRFITPLVDIVIGTGSDEQQLSEKAKGIFSNRLAPKLGQLSSDVPQSQLVKSYLDIHHYARRVRVPGLQMAFKTCSLNLTKCLLNAGAVDVVLDTYRASLADFFTRKNSALQPTFFEDFLRQNRSVGWELRQDILDNSSKALNGHRQSQAFQFLHVLLPVVSTTVRA